MMPTHCGGKLKVRDELARKKVKCPKCEQLPIAEPDIDDDEDDIPLAVRGGCSTFLIPFFTVLVCLAGIAGSIMATGFLMASAPRDQRGGDLFMCGGVFVPGAFLGVLLGLIILKVYRRRLDALVERGDAEAIKKLLSIAYPDNAASLGVRLARKKVNRDPRLHALLVTFVVAAKVDCYRAEHALAAFGAPALELLAKKIGSSSRNKRWRAAKVLAMLNWEPPSEKARERFDSLRQESAAAAARERATVMLFGIEYRETTTFSELHAALAQGKRVMYRFNCTNYITVMRELAHSMTAEFGAESPETKAIPPSPLVCPRCSTLFPDLWKVRAATESGGAVCPGCGHDKALLVLVIYRPEDITEADVDALRAYWRSNGEEPEAIESKLENGLQKLKKNPHHFGTMELWLAHNFAAQKG